MLEREIFRKSSTEKMTSPDDLDELLQVNSVNTWLLLAAISVVLAGLLVWGFLGTISKEVNGFGIIKIQELPRQIVTDYPGQVDSVFCRTGDRVTRNQKVMTIYLSETKTFQEIVSPFAGEITGIDVKEGSYVHTGSTVLTILKSYDSLIVAPEVIFFVAVEEVTKLKKGMTANLQVDKGGIPAEYLCGTITFIAGYPASNAAVQKYFPDKDISLYSKKNDLYEVRGLLVIGDATRMKPDQSILCTLNGLSCQVTVTVDRQSPVKYLFK